MNIGDIVVNKADYTAAAIWCNKNNAHIEKQDGKYVIVANPVVEIEVDDTPTMEDRLTATEEAISEIGELLAEILEGAE